MTTTATPSQAPASRRLWGPALGALASLTVFSLGAYVLVLPALLVALRRARGFGFAFLLGGLTCLALSALGHNPLLMLARERALDQIEVALGARPEYADFKGSAVTGELQFSGVTCEIPDVGGRLTVESFEVSVLPGLLWPGPPRVWARGVSVELAPDGQGLRRWAERLELHPGRAFEAELSNVTLAIEGPMVSARAFAPKVTARGDGEQARLQAQPQWIELTVNRRAHALSLLGSVEISRQSAGFGLHCNLHFLHEQAGRGVIRGDLTPEFREEGLRITLDHAQLAPIWDRYATWSQFSGEGQGVIDVAGDFTRLRLRPRLTLSGLDYFHTTAMKLDRSRRFSVPQAEITGELHVLSGRDFEFIAIRGVIPDCPLATDPVLNARGALDLTVNGVWPALSGSVQATLREGNVLAPLEFTRTGRPLSDLEPNSIPLIELLPSFNLTLQLKVEKLDVACKPLTGKLAGELTGSLIKKSDEPFVSVRLAGELALAEGRFDFCEARGEAEGKLVFSPLAPPREASLRGHLKGKARETPLNIEVTGRLSAPGLIFKQVAMRPDDLGRVIAGLDNPDVSAAQRVERVADITRMCGVVAATRGNPFEMAGLGEIFLDFRAGD